MGGTQRAGTFLVVRDHTCMHAFMHTCTQIPLILMQVKDGVKNMGATGTGATVCIPGQVRAGTPQTEHLSIFWVASSGWCCLTNSPYRSSESSVTSVPT